MPDFPEIFTGTRWDETHARQWRNAMDAVARLDGFTVSHPLTLHKSQGSMRLEILEQPDRPTIGTKDQRFQIVNQEPDLENGQPGATIGWDQDNYLICQKYDPALVMVQSDDAHPLVKATGSTFKVWKPTSIRRLEYDELRRILGVGLVPTYTSAGTQLRLGEIDDGTAEGVTELQLVIPRYWQGLSIMGFHRTSVLGGISHPDATSVEDDIEWMARVEGRAWGSINRDDE